MSAALPPPGVHRVGAAVRRLLDRWSRRCTVARTEQALAELDPRTLRDVGLDRSELGSVHAEVLGLVESTRRRLAVST